MRYGCGIWKSIQRVKDVFWKFIHFKLGSRNEIRFWEDRWLGEVPIKEAFRNLYSLALDPKVMVVDLYDEQGGGGVFGCLCFAET